MNKVKMFFIAAALVLTTAGVFAGKARFDITSAVLYAYDGVHTASPIVTTSVTLKNATTTGTNQAIVNDDAGNPYGLYSNSACTTKVYFNGF